MVTSKPNWEWTIEEEALGRKQNICKSSRTEDQVSWEEKNSQGYWTYQKHSFLEGGRNMSLAHYMGESSHFFWGGGGTRNIKVAHQRVGGSGRSRGGARGGRVPPSPYFIPNWGPKGGKNLFWRPAPPPPPRSQGLDDRLPPVILKIWIRHSVGVGVDRKFGSCSMCRFQLSSVIVGIDVMWFL